MKTYDRRGFALAYIDANNPSDIGFDAERVGYPEALHGHRTALLAGIERLFGITLEMAAVPAGMRPVLLVFRSVARSYASIAGPMDGYLEAGLIHDRLEQVGIHDAFLSGIGWIAELNEESRVTHLDILTTLLGVLLGDNADKVISAEELQALGVNTVPPNPTDFGF
ncbi:hypothetical protein [Nocardia jejuensis]|uniref:hypothetical protein n=1 Tax=Nocardia jejuensis TaxID=328049 RepID=UPI00083586E6|nr:hypothetical protein [Nocardia jejuensis]